MLLGIDFSERDVAVILANVEGQVEVALRAELPHVGGASAQWLRGMDVAREVLLQAHVVASQVQTTLVAFHAPLDEDGVIRKDARAAQWANFDLPRALREHLHLENVSARPRVLCEAIAEERLGALRATGEITDENWLYLHLGETLEAVARASGVLLRGANGAALEIGAICIERGGAISDSGRRGSLDAYCGGESFLARARSYGIAAKDPHEIWQMADANLMAKSLCDDYVERLAQGLGAAISILNPSRLCLGGEFEHALGDKLVQALALPLREYSLPLHLRNLEISLGQLGRDAAILGTVSLARDALK
jgi:predicted NBD/HSP70 family sugar kinase